jgi:hypothetical protein
MGAARTILILGTRVCRCPLERDRLDGHPKDSSTSLFPARIGLQESSDTWVTPPMRCTPSSWGTELESVYSGVAMARWGGKAGEEKPPGGTLVWPGIKRLKF